MCADAQTANLLNRKLVLVVYTKSLSTLETSQLLTSCAVCACQGMVHGSDLTKGDEVMLWTILVILLVLWLLGFSFGIGGGTSLIHILLVVAAIVLVYNLVARRGTV